MSPALPTQRTRVAIVGSGASGMSAAYALSRHPDKFEVTVFDKEPQPGGMATSVDIDPEKYGASYINDGVQGCSPAFANTIRMFRELGFAPTSVGMQISFGKGEDFWSNVFTSELTAQFSSDIKKFGRVLKIIKKLEVPFAVMPVNKMLRLFRFSKDFGEKMVYPLVALFFGTGNQTPYISCAILERVFMDPSMRLFEFDEKSLLASIPTMYAFPKLGDTYKAWEKRTSSTGNVTFKLGHEVTRIVRRDKREVVLEYRPPPVPSASFLVSDHNPPKVEEPQPQLETFDELILACDADTSLKLLNVKGAAGPSWMERKVLGNVKYLWDVTITHNDADYMRKYYETGFNKNLAADPNNLENQESIRFAEKNFRPLYYTMQYPTDKSKIEMSFDLTHYQPQFRGEKPSGPIEEVLRGRAESDGDPATSCISDSHAPNGEGNSRDALVQEAQRSELGAEGAEARKGSDPEGNNEPKFEDHVFQTIFLDRDGSSQLWTEGEIRQEKRIYEKWWKQQSHRWQHYAGVVPWMMWINGKRRTHYAGAWSILNMHELAVTSGFAAAYRLGADYPFKGDEDCQRLFRLYLAASHGIRMRKEDREGMFA